MPDSEQTLPPCIHCGETRGHTYGCEHPYPSSRQQIPQENVPFAIRDIAANEPAQTLPVHEPDPIMEAGEARLNYHTMINSARLGAEPYYDIEMACDYGGCDADAVFVGQHQLSTGSPGGDDYYVVTIARCQRHGTMTRGMPR